MISTYQRLKRMRDAGEIEGGFTLIELLIVIVVLGILAAVVIFALGGITGKSAVAACQADGATLATAVAAYTASTGNAGTYAVTSSSGTLKDIVTSNLVSAAQTGVQSWPSNDPHYAFAIYNGVLGVEAPGPTTGYWAPAAAFTAPVITSSPTTAEMAAGIPYTGPNSCAHIS
jgi:general secretion pathway protein G